MGDFCFLLYRPSLDKLVQETSSVQLHSCKNFLWSLASLATTIRDIKDANDTSKLSFA